MHADSGTSTADGRAAARGPVAVVGAGLTGASWAGLYAAAGLEVRLYDVDLARLEAAVERAAAAAGFLAGSGLADMQTAERGVPAAHGDRGPGRGGRWSHPRAGVRARGPGDQA